MILISSIEPIDLASTYTKISDLELDYLLKFQDGYRPQELMYSAIASRRRKSSSKKNTIELAILSYLFEKFDFILLQEPEELHDTIGYFNKKGWQKYVYANGESTLFGKELLEIFGYKENFRSQVKRGIWLTKQLNIKSCPYCNAQYTIIATTSKGKSIAKLQFDHFFSKDKYPYLSISLYNLIPACANCNLTKSKKLLSLKNHYHPYYLVFSLIAFGIFFVKSRRSHLL